jgi:hypothetical protein
MTIETFKIQISDKTLEDLSFRLSNTKWPNQLKDSNWESGTKKDYMQSLISYWRSDYNWCLFRTY